MTRCPIWRPLCKVDRAAEGRHLPDGGEALETVRGLVGLLAFMLLAFALSASRRDVRWKVAAAGVALQLVLGALLLLMPGTQSLFSAIGRGVDAIYLATLEGTQFVFGYLGGGDMPFETMPAATTFILAFQSLPVLLFMSVLTAILTYWRILPWVVRWLGRGLQRSLGIGGALGLGAAGNVFLGMVEAPLLIRPYLDRMTRSELFALMTTGMATVAGTVLVLYAQTLSAVLPNAAGHMLVASLISLPAAVSIDVYEEFSFLTQDRLSDADHLVSDKLEKGFLIRLTTESHYRALSFA
ncbi:MAG: Na+ dependent nucleoside transporter N-terminal domain-containing protein, partial [Hyphomicrobiaceae bacterium]